MGRAGESGKSRRAHKGVFRCDEGAEPLSAVLVVLPMDSGGDWPMCCGAIQHERVSTADEGRDVQKRNEQSHDLRKRASDEPSVHDVVLGARVLVERSLRVDPDLETFTTEREISADFSNSEDSGEQPQYQKLLVRHQTRKAEAPRLLPPSWTCFARQLLGYSPQNAGLAQKRTPQAREA